MVAKLTEGVKRYSLKAPKWQKHQGDTVNRPHWDNTNADLAATLLRRQRITTNYEGSPITIDLIGEGTLGIVQKYRPTETGPQKGDFVWIKEMSDDGRTILDLQTLEEGLPGGVRCVTRVAMLERAESEALELSAEGTLQSLLALLGEKDDRRLRSLFIPHILLLEILDKQRPLEKRHGADRMHAKRMLEGCLTLKDATGRRNPNSKVWKEKSARCTLRKMSKRRMKNAKMANANSIAAYALMRAVNALISSVRIEIESKLNANTWSLKAIHKRWLVRFANTLNTWATTIENGIDVKPFARRASVVSVCLRNASDAINDAIEGKHEIHFEKAKRELRTARAALMGMEARCATAEILEVVGVAKDPRVQQLNIAIEAPAWEQITQNIVTTETRWSLPVPHELDTGIAQRNATTTYEGLRKFVRQYDDPDLSA